MHNLASQSLLNKLALSWWRCTPAKRLVIQVLFCLAGLRVTYSGCTSLSKLKNLSVAALNPTQHSNSARADTERLHLSRVWPHRVTRRQRCSRLSSGSCSTLFISLGSQSEIHTITSQHSRPIHFCNSSSGPSTVLKGEVPLICQAADFTVLPSRPVAEHLRT